MDIDTAVKTIKSNVLEQGQTLSWWDSKKKKHVKKLLEALNALKESGRVAGSYRERIFNFTYELLGQLDMYYDSRTTPEGIHDFFAGKTEFRNIFIGKIKDEQVNDYLMRIAYWFDREAEVHAPLGLFRRTGDEFTACMPGCNCCCAILPGGGVAVYSDEYDKVKRDLGKLDESPGQTMDLGGWTGSMMPRHYKEQIVAYLPATKKALPEVKDMKDLVYFDEKTIYACDFLGTLDEGEWRNLVERFRVLIRKFHPGFEIKVDFPGRFQGGFCSVHDRRPKECRDTECTYSARILPELLEKAPDLVVEMLRTEKLIDRYKIAEDFLRRG